MPPDADTWNPGASRTQNMPVIAPRCALRGFLAPGGVLALWEPYDAANILLRERSWVFRYGYSLRLIPFEGHVDEQRSTLRRIAPPDICRTVRALG